MWQDLNLFDVLRLRFYSVDCQDETKIFDLIISSGALHGIDLYTRVA